MLYGEDWHQGSSIDGDDVAVVAVVVGGDAVSVVVVAMVWRTCCWII